MTGYSIWVENADGDDKDIDVQLSDDEKQEVMDILHGLSADGIVADFSVDAYPTEAGVEYFRQELNPLLVIARDIKD